MRRAVSILILLSCVFVACGGQEVDLGTPDSRDRTEERPSSDEGRLTARPSGQGHGEFTTGLQELDLERKALLYVPSTYAHSRPSPFMLLFHGAGAGVDNQMKRLQEEAERRGIILLAVKSRAATWDRTFGPFGPDLQLIDDALHIVFERFSTDPKHLAVEGFSDGASYALSVGLTNGDLFSHVIAFSAGSPAPADTRGSPRIWVAHGTDDPILPIDATARNFVPRLEKAGYDVTYFEFPGGHLASPSTRSRALDWFLR